VFLTHGCAWKKPEDDLFDLIVPTKVNKHLQQLMPGLTIKVFPHVQCRTSLISARVAIEEGCWQVAVKLGLISS
jgi:hypothetical protein